MGKYWLLDSEYGRKLSAQKGQRLLKQHGNPAGTKLPPPTACGLEFDGQTTQLKSGRIVAQKRSARV